eukprot:1376212-Rhodomonas_salina.2
MLVPDITWHVRHHTLGQYRACLRRLIAPSARSVADIAYHARRQEAVIRSVNTGHAVARA